ncbi:N-acetylmuramoyl-L-alanine amidase [Pseudaestuariivita atlantica]|uniref:N-acetylmuramoyl-L-alanine amidase n=1 Tax=Pseudaestuariivita atlantica TaxID=1317121 RepID=A0A0L1JU42_9RHOB|nr:N-acetylmuramoyl-L-alanine amidase [Pseudaestuariivita atlantica]KNG95294.1 N-acetylmuramoyl-L-alanine amidase [Pseudaestuariivita atlantica]
MRWTTWIITGLLALVACAAAAQDFSALARVDAGASVLEDRRGGARMALHLSQGVPFRVRMRSAPDQVILDFREVDWTGLTAEGFDRSDRVGGVRFGPFQPGWSRLVLDLAEPMVVTEAGLQVDTGGAVLTVEMARADRETFDAAVAAVPDLPGWDLPDPADVAPPRAELGAGGAIVVMIDPGHGGIDPGAEAAGVKEADLMLRLARELRDAIRRTEGLDAVLTRDSDTFVALERRVALAKAADADLFVSLHADALADGHAQGATVYVLDEDASDAASAALAERHDREDLLAGVDLTGAEDEVARVLMDLARTETAPRSEALARHLVERIEDAVGEVHKRPLRRASFSVLKAADIPSVLVEVGFLSTQADLDRLQDAEWRGRMVMGVRDGIIAWVLEDAALAPLRRQ